MKKKKNKYKTVDPIELIEGTKRAIAYVELITATLRELKLENVISSLAENTFSPQLREDDKLSYLISFSHRKEIYKLFFGFSINPTENSIRVNMDNNWNPNEIPNHLYSWFSNYWISFQKGKSIDPLDGKNNHFLFLVDGSNHWEVAIKPHHIHTYDNNGARSKGLKFPGTYFSLIEQLVKHLDLQLEIVDLDVDTITKSTIYEHLKFGYLTQ